MAQGSEKSGTSRFGAAFNNLFGVNNKPRKPKPSSTHYEGTVSYDRAANLMRDLPPAPQKWSSSSADSGRPVDLGVVRLALIDLKSLLIRGIQVRTRSQTPSESSYNRTYTPSPVSFLSSSISVCPAQPKTIDQW